MIYVDGMNAVINQNEVVQWLYSLVESSVRKEKKFKYEIISSFLVSTCCKNKFKIINCLC
jgi:hypothetical protein